MYTGFPVYIQTMISLRNPDRLLIQTERMILRIPRRGDEGAMVQFYTENRDFLQPFSPVLSNELFSLRGWRGRIDSTLMEYRSGKGIRLAFFDRDDPSQVMGVANLTSITGYPGFMCNLGYSMAEAYQGKGLMTEGLRAAIDYVFAERGIHRIEANYMPRNERSARVLEKLGFVIEGKAREYILINGIWEDHVRTSLTNPLWKVSM